MLVRLFNLLFLIVGASIGYLCSREPFAIWFSDIVDMVQMTWTHERASRGASGTISLLVAGFLLGQGAFLLVRVLLSRIGPWQTRAIEKIASWDASLKLGTRFGLHQYLATCAIWAAEDPTARMQTLALFKVHGLGAINDISGTLVTTQLLQRIAVEIRSASLPESVSPTRRFIAHYLPTLPKFSRGRIPPARFPARWSGATFALAFRELDALQAVSIAKHVSNWIRCEIHSIPGGTESSTSTVVVVGTADGSPRGLTAIATSTLASAKDRDFTIVVDKSDMRADALGQLSGSALNRVEMLRAASETLGGDVLTNENSSLIGWLRTWGTSFGCLVGALVLLATTRGNAPPPNTFPWPSSLNEVQIVDSNGPRIVHLKRQDLAAQNSDSWQIDEVQVIQGDVRDGYYGPFQVRLRIKNVSEYSSYVSPLNLSAVDQAGNVRRFDPLRTLRISKGLDGRWLRPGESWTGWLVGTRAQDPITAIRVKQRNGKYIELRRMPMDT